MKLLLIILLFLPFVGYSQDFEDVRFDVIQITDSTGNQNSIVGWSCCNGDYILKGKIPKNFRAEKIKSGHFYIQIKSEPVYQNGTLVEYGEIKIKKTNKPDNHKP